MGRFVLHNIRLKIDSLLPMRGIAMHEKRKGPVGRQLLLGAFFLVAVILPLIRMLMNLGSVDVGAILLSDGFRQALLNS